MSIILFERSFSSHEKSQFWSDKNKLKPSEVYKKSGKKFIFNCNNCSHEFEASLDNITIKNQWCPYCCNPSKKLCEKEDCRFCYEQSFASHEKAKYWSNKNVDENNKFIKPRQIFKKCDTIKYILYCDLCNHNFERALYNVVNDKDKTHCIYCVIPSKILCEKEDCNFCYERSFESHEKARYWSDKNKLKPRQVFKGSNKKYIFNCNKSHEFSATLAHIVNGTWCPICVNKTEQILYEKLMLIYSQLKRQYKVEWCKNINYLPFDFALEEQKIIIELDGPHILYKLVIGNLQKKQMKLINIRSNVQTIMGIQLFVFYKKMFIMISMIGYLN